MKALGGESPPQVQQLDTMNIEKTIDDIEQLEEMFEAPDIRPLSASDVSAANQKFRGVEVK
jgi:hypothetical protein